MGKTTAQYDEVFEELMFYRVIDVNTIRSRSDIADQLRVDKRIGFMKNRNLFVDKMLETFPAKLISSGKLDTADYKVINQMSMGYNKEKYKKLVDKRFKNRFEQKEQDKDFIMVDGYIFDITSQSRKKVNARIDLVSMERGKRVILRDVSTGKFVSASATKKDNKKNKKRS